MATLTRTERTLANAGLGIYNPLVAYAGANSQHRGWSPCTMLVYLKPTGNGVTNLLIDRSQTSTQNGLRLLLTSAGALSFTARSSTGNTPNKTSSDPIPAGEWSHIAATWDGGHLASSINLYHAPEGEAMGLMDPGSANDGATAALYPINEAHFRALRLYNTSVSGQPYNPTRADVAYIAVWKAVLSLEELEDARTLGPLSVRFEDCVLMRANGVDLSDYAALTTTEPPFPDGDLPPILTLGGDSGPLAIAPAKLGWKSQPMVLPNPALALKPQKWGLKAAPMALPIPQIHDDFERSSIDASQSSVTTDTDGVTLITLRNRLQTITSLGTNRWLEPVAKITGVLGMRPRFELTPFQTGAGDNRNHQTWGTSQRGHYSYDGKTWYPIAAKTATSTRLTLRHDSAFIEDMVYIARSWPRSVTQIGEQIQELAAQYPDIISPAPGAATYTPTNPALFPAEDFIVQECSARTDELGRSVPVTPLYGFRINDSNYGPKKFAAYFTMGIHAGEDVGELMGWGLVHYLLSDAPSAVALRAVTDISIFPCLNAPGRWAGYWRGAPGSNTDPNREWLTSSPTHDFVAKMKAVLLADKATKGLPVAWSFEIHASPGGDGAMQMGVNVHRATTIAFDTLVRSKYPSGSWADYGDRNEELADPATVVTLAGFHRRDLESKFVMLFESCDRFGPLSPSTIAPYAEAAIESLAEMMEDGWFGADPIEPQTGVIEWVGGTPTVEQAFEVEPSTGVIEWTGGAPIIEQPLSITPVTAVIEWVGGTPEVLQSFALEVVPQTGVITWEGGAPVVEQPITVTTATGEIIWEGGAPTIEQGTEEFPPDDEEEFSAGEAVAQGHGLEVSETVEFGMAQAVAYGTTLSFLEFGKTPASRSIKVGAQDRTIRVGKSARST